MQPLLFLPGTLHPGPPDGRSVIGALARRVAAAPWIGRTGALQSSASVELARSRVKVRNFRAGVEVSMTFGTPLCPARRRSVWIWTTACAPRNRGLSGECSWASPATSSCPAFEAHPSGTDEVAADLKPPSARFTEKSMERQVCTGHTSA
ncbi:hypothetical protein BV20DRAFT_674651 [Pilatotrama ljubarskyi]|nr:hypothetical protein BV20DRAFT_674651 [Pilatotrama ljubarskyi]